MPIHLFCPSGRGDFVSARTPADGGRLGDPSRISSEEAKQSHTRRPDYVLYTVVQCRVFGVVQVRQARYNAVGSSSGTRLFACSAPPTPWGPGQISGPPGKSLRKWKLCMGHKMATDLDTVHLPRDGLRCRVSHVLQSDFVFLTCPRPGFPCGGAS
jgi:hypothetical protein